MGGVSVATKAYYCNRMPEILPTSHLAVLASTNLENGQERALDPNYGSPSAAHELFEERIHLTKHVHSTTGHSIEKTATPVNGYHFRRYASFLVCCAIMI